MRSRSSRSRCRSRSETSCSALRRSLSCTSTSRRAAVPASPAARPKASPASPGAALDLLAELREDRALVLAGGLELLHLRFEPRLGLPDRLALALRQLGETGRQSLLDPVEVGGPFGQTLLDAALDETEGLAELARDPSLSLSQF